MKVILDLTKLKNDPDFPEGKSCLSEYDEDNFYCDDCEYKLVCKNIAEA